MGLLGFSWINFSSFFCHKLGCFKRKTLEYYQEQEERASLQAGGDTDLTSDFTEGTASHSQANGKSDEEKDLLDLGQADGATQPGDTKEELD